MVDIPLDMLRGANFVHNLDGTFLVTTDPPVKWHNACLRPDGIHNEDDKINYSHIIPSADNLGAFVRDQLGIPDYTSLAEYKSDYDEVGVQPDDIIIFHNPYDADRGWAHIGLGSSPNYNEGNFMPGLDETNIWILRRSSWGEPV